MKNQTFEWIIHLVANGAGCAKCGEVESEFIPYTCNAHTHGMEKYNHMDFQLVLRLPTEEIGRILNTLGCRVQQGEKFHNGDYVKGIYDDCDICLQEFEETGRKVLRVIIPDANNIFPNDPRCASPYNLQLLKTDDLTQKKLLS